MNDILKLIELCEKESDEHYSFNFTIDKYGVRLNGYYHSAPGVIPIFNFSRLFTEDFIMCADKGLDIHNCCEYEIDKFKKEVENGND